MNYKEINNILEKDLHALSISIFTQFREESLEKKK